MAGNTEVAFYLKTTRTKFILKFKKKKIAIFQQRSKLQPKLQSTNHRLPSHMVRNNIQIKIEIDIKLSFRTHICVLISHRSHYYLHFDDYWSKKGTQVLNLKTKFFM